MTRAASDEQIRRVLLQILSPLTDAGRAAGSHQNQNRALFAAVFMLNW